MRAAKIAGFELRIHWGTLVTFVLLVWSLAAVQLPEAAPQATDTSVLVVAVLAGVAF
jgi:hypothetical protein